MKINEYLKEHRLIPDGSMGTYYSNIVNQPGAVSEYANLSAPEIIERIHRDYIEAGARMLRTNTFAANLAVLKIDRTKQKQLVKAACQIAKKAVAESETIKRDQQQI